jgi:hypothetical protein
MALGLFNVRVTRESIHEQQRLAQSGVRGVANIVERLYMAPNASRPASPTA